MENYVISLKEFKNNQFPIVCNVDAQSVIDGSLACDALVRQVCSPVRWVDTMQHLVDKGIEVVVELGTGKVLSKLMRRFNKDIKCFQVQTPANHLHSVASHLRRNGVVVIGQPATRSLLP